LWRPPLGIDRRPAAPHTELLDLQPLPVSALKNPQFPQDPACRLLGHRGGGREEEGVSGLLGGGLGKIDRLGGLEKGTEVSAFAPFRDML